MIARYLNAEDDKIVPIADELQLKLSQKYFELYGLAGEGDERLLSCNTVGATEELVAFASGKEFSLLQTATGKVRQL